MDKKIQLSSSIKQSLNIISLTCPVTHLANKILETQGTWVAQWVKWPTLDIGSGHDMGIMGLSPTSGCTLSWESA